ncbi:MAG TPA: DUF6468 domain-containing protein [Candidatus Cybelea sp.]|nr:DUF6468 domain-containing protein [Candidatus Cybelea sp.]
MSVIGLLADGLLIVLLGVALVSIYRLNGRMAEMREGRAAFEKLTADLVRQTDVAAAALAELKRGAETLGKQLETGAEKGRQVIAEVQRASDDLRLLIGRSEAAATRLEGSIATARRGEAVAAAMDGRPAERKPEPEAGLGTEEPVPPEAAAFLSSLSGMR